MYVCTCVCARVHACMCVHEHACMCVWCIPESVHIHYSCFGGRDRWAGTGALGVGVQVHCSELAHNVTVHPLVTAALGMEKSVT